jgi:hypothetical protein
MLGAEWPRASSEYRAAARSYSKRGALGKERRASKRKSRVGGRRRVGGCYRGSRGYAEQQEVGPDRFHFIGKASSEATVLNRVLVLWHVP